ncbi:MAG: GTP pyrophosphokinase [Clostridiales bacterium]|jgi:hypothetical protein|nr:GTP pyrophosphokinase [Clostridiales bacterium]
MTLLSTALQIAVKAHDGQKDKAGVDYIWHPITVAGFCNGEKGKLAAILHDTVEDSDVTLDGLREAGIGEDIVTAVDCLSKRKDESLDAYYGRVAANDIAIEVKFADMRHNGDRARWPKESRDKAEDNYIKYAGRTVSLYEAVGERAKTLMSEGTLDLLLKMLEERGGSFGRREG